MKAYQIKTKTMRIIIAGLVLVSLLFIINNLLVSRNITPVGEELKSLRQIKRDVKEMFSGEYSIVGMELSYIKDALKVWDSEALEKGAQAHKLARLISVSIKDKKFIFPNWGSFDQDMVATSKAIDILYYLTSRVYDSSITTIKLTYYPKVLAMSKNGSVIIDIQEFVEVRRTLEETELTEEKIKEKLQEHFYQYTRFHLSIAPENLSRSYFLGEA